VSREDSASITGMDAETAARRWADAWSRAPATTWKACRLRPADRARSLRILTSTGDERNALLTLTVKVAGSS